MGARTSKLFGRTPAVIDHDTLKEHCSKSGHGSYAVVEVEQFDGSYKRCECPKCFWEARTLAPEESDDRRAAVEALRAQKLNELLIASGITPRFRDCTLDSFRTNDDVAQQKALKKCQAYVGDFPANWEAGRCLLMLGNIGCGKTHLGSAIVQSVIRIHGAHALIVSASEVIRVAKGSMAKGAQYTESDILSELGSLDLLVLDEVGAQRGSEYEIGLLHEVLDRRYQNVLPTVVISNLGRQDLTAYIGERALDRLRQNGGQAVGFTWSSARASV